MQTNLLFYSQHLTGVFRYNHLVLVPFEPLFVGIGSNRYIHHTESSHTSLDLCILDELQAPDCFVVTVEAISIDNKAKLSNNRVISTVNKHTICFY